MQINMNEEVKAKKVYTTQDIKKAGFTLEPLQCVHCGGVGEVVFNQYLNDGLCQLCGEWQECQANNDCETCNGLGYVHTNNEQCDDEIQRCDDCQQFKSDADAKSSLKNTNLTRDNLKEYASRLGYDLSDEDCNGMIANAYDGETASEVFTGFLNTFKR